MKELKRSEDNEIRVCPAFAWRRHQVLGVPFLASPMK